MESISTPLCASSKAYIDFFTRKTMLLLQFQEPAYFLFVGNGSSFSGKPLEASDNVKEGTKGFFFWYVNKLKGKIYSWSMIQSDRWGLKLIV